MVKGKLYGTFQMLINASLTFIGKWNDFIKKCCIPGFRNVFVNCGEQPEGIIRTVGGMTCFLYIGGIIRCILMPGVMGKFYKRKTTAVVYLCREHEPDLFTSHFRCKMDNSLDVLYGITVTVAVSKSTVNKGGCP